VRWLGQYRAAKMGLIWILHYKDTRSEVETEIDLAEKLSKAKVYTERHARGVLL
jgi:hypothetical protein